MSPVRWLSLAVVLGTFAVPAQAHEVRPAYLEVTQTGPETYDLAFKVPGKGDLRLRLLVKLPSAASPWGTPSASRAGTPS